MYHFGFTSVWYFKILLLMFLTQLKRNLSQVALQSLWAYSSPAKERSQVRGAKFKSSENTHALSGVREHTQSYLNNSKIHCVQCLILIIPVDGAYFVGGA